MKIRPLLCLGFALFTVSTVQADSPPDLQPLKR
jgi:hypothetical protein